MANRTLEVSAQIKDGAIFFREQLAHADLPGGRKLEVATSGGSILVTLSPHGEKGSRTYRITPEALAEALRLVEPEWFGEEAEDGDTDA